MNTAVSDSVARPGADRSTDPYLPRHGNGGYRVTHYDLDLDYRVEPNRLDGGATITAVADACALAGHARPGRAAGHRREGQRPTRRSTSTSAASYASGPPGRSPAHATFTVAVRYAGRPRPVSGPWGDIGWDELTDGALVASQPIGAPSWFPCNDHPSDKASYRVAVTTSPAYTVAVTGNLVLAGPQRGRHPVGVRAAGTRRRRT